MFCNASGAMASSGTWIQPGPRNSFWTFSWQVWKSMVQVIPSSSKYSRMSVVTRSIVALWYATCFIAIPITRLDAAHALLRCGPRVLIHRVAPTRPMVCCDWFDTIVQHRFRCVRYQQRNQSLDRVRRSQQTWAGWDDSALLEASRVDRSRFATECRHYAATAQRGSWLLRFSEVKTRKELRQNVVPLGQSSAHRDRSDRDNQGRGHVSARPIVNDDVDALTIRLAAWIAPAAPRILIERRWTGKQSAPRIAPPRQCHASNARP